LAWQNICTGVKRVNSHFPLHRLSAKSHSVFCGQWQAISFLLTVYVRSPHKARKMAEVLAIGEMPAVACPAPQMDSAVVRARMESAGAARQTMQAPSEASEGAVRITR
ncbi:MAG: hypothetical protein ACK40L_11335, partial [Hydrogenophaga sp.]